MYKHHRQTVLCFKPFNLFSKTLVPCVSIHFFSHILSERHRNFCPLYMACQSGSVCGNISHTMDEYSRKRHAITKKQSSKIRHYNRSTRQETTSKSKSLYPARKTHLRWGPNKYKNETNNMKSTCQMPTQTSCTQRKLYSIVSCWCSRWVLDASR